MSTWKRRILAAVVLLTPVAAFAATAAARADLHRNLQRLADGDRSAFSSVYKALWPVLRAFVVRQLPPSDSEDVAQDALLKVFARASDFDPEREAVTWALGIAAFEVRTARKRAARRKEELVEHLPSGIQTASPEEAIMDRNLEAAALEVLGALPFEMEARARTRNGFTGASLCRGSPSWPPCQAGSCTSPGQRNY
jgi:RNA polymerase sigma-70 factor (ECF subfamily)